MTAAAQNILKTLGYFDLFSYPLTREEIYFFSPENTDTDEVVNELERLLNAGKVFRTGSFYALHDDQLLAQRRNNGNRLAAAQMKTAQRIAKFLFKFPYVKGIAVSGSLSKNFATEKTDIDFFIITAANRLWIARTCMHLYKKITFLTGRQNWYCMNYYVDEAAMEIQEQNIFTAIEIVTLLPMHGKKCLHEFMEQNTWTKKFFPLKCPGEVVLTDLRKGFFSRAIEHFFSGGFGHAVDKKLMYITARRWQNKVKRQQINRRGEPLGMHVGRHFSKPDPKNFQEKVINAYRKKVDEIMQQRTVKRSFVL